MNGEILHSFRVLFIIGYDAGYRHWTLEMRRHSLRRWSWHFGHSLLVYLIRVAAAFEALSALVVDFTSLGIYPSFCMLYFT